MFIVKRLAKIAPKWPIAMVGFGLVLTLIWSSALIWFPVHYLLEKI